MLRRILTPKVLHYSCLFDDYSLLSIEALFLDCQCDGALGSDLQLPPNPHQGDHPEQWHEGGFGEFGGRDGHCGGVD